MKSLKFLPIFILFSFSNLYAQTKYIDNIVSAKSEYAGVYEGYLDISLCCEMYETGFGKIVFFYRGDSLKCLYDGVFLDEINLVKNTFAYTNQFDNGADDTKELIFGSFMKNKEKNDGFLYSFQESRVDESLINFPGPTTFLEKIGDADMARNLYLNAENELNEFKIFESEFRTALANKNEKKLVSMINLPFYDKRQSWDYPSELTDRKDLRVLFKEIFTTELYGDGFRHQNSDKNFWEAYTIQGDKMFFYFKKIGSEFKLVYITGVFG